MQLQALLESLTRFTYQTPPITVVLKDRSEYGSLKKEYPDIIWINETSQGFGEALRAGIAFGEEELVMFAVDDQLIVGSMDFMEAARAMRATSVHCYSFRLGDNITGVPLDRGEIGNHSWSYPWWRKVKDWAYPFSMDTCVYRKEDLKPLLTSKVEYRAPADFEAAGLIYFENMINPEDPNHGLHRPRMAVHAGNSVAYCQDVNKVQLFHGAPEFGTPGVHDVESLVLQYVQGFRLDWESAIGKVHNDPFVRQSFWNLRLSNVPMED